MTNQDQRPLPPGWELTQVGAAVVDIQPGFASGKHNSDGKGLPHFRPMNVSTSGRIDRTVTKFVAPDLADRPGRRLRRGDVLFNNTNSIDLVGKTAYFGDDDFPAYSNHMTRLRVDHEKVTPEYLARYLHACWSSGEFTQLANNHVSQASVGRKTLSSLPLPLPPLEQQRRIVALLDQVDRGRDEVTNHLVRAQGLLAGFRRAVLVAACSGRLTEDWRQQHPDARAIDPEQLAVSAKVRRRRPDVSLDIEVPDVPDSYVVAPIVAIATAVEYGTSRKADGDESHVPVLRMGNIQDGAIGLADLKYITPDSEVERLLLSDGDLLFNRTNSPELVGKSAVWRSSRRATFASYLIRVKFHEEVAVPEFVNYWINSAWGRIWARQVKTDGVSQSNINGTKLGAMPVPLPPVDEQREIVRRVEQLLKGSEEILARVNATSSLLKRTGQSALAKAFRGELPH
ncbi:restriction endonuclease subunit S [Streptomyces pseudogriseolus]|uniref:restriction endonuclease subunit S n=1 Tax=Streptomyces pseudogriseolus TaxID=36817 RepID=UPI003FA2207E|nr:restriction endonuclease subunit S [Streptomyces pseudogriseolus]